MVILRWEDAEAAVKTGLRLGGDDSEALRMELAAAVKDGVGVVRVRLDVAKHAFYMLQARAAPITDNREFGRLDHVKQRIRRALRDAGYDI